MPDWPFDTTGLRPVPLNGAVLWEPIDPAVRAELQQRACALVVDAAEEILREREAAALLEREKAA